MTTVKRPVGPEAIREIASYVSALRADDLSGPNYPEPGEFAGRKLKSHERVRPVGDYIHGVYVAETERMHQHPDGPGWHGQVCASCWLADVITLQVSQYLTNCPVAGYGPDIPAALADLQRRWSTPAAAARSLAAAGWGPDAPGTYSHPAYSGATDSDQCYDEQ